METRHLGKPSALPASPQEAQLDFVPTPRPGGVCNLGPCDFLGVGTKCPAGGYIAWQMVAASPNDGYTVLVAENAIGINQAVF